MTLAVSWDRYALGAAYLRRHPPRFFTALYNTGAGISVSSGLPLWKPIKQQVYSDIFDVADTREVDEFLKKQFSNPEFLQKHVLPEWTDENIKKLCTQLRDGESPPPEVVFAFFRQNYGDLALGDQLRRLFEQCLPSPAYAAVLRILAGGFSRYYLTVNQDGLIEVLLLRHLHNWRVTALTSDEDFAVYDRPDTDKLTIPASHSDLSRIVVANLHGSYTRPETLQITPESLLEQKDGGGHLTTARHRFMEHALQRARVLVIIGYKGNDADIVKPLKSILTASDCGISDIVAVRSSDCLSKLSLNKRQSKVYDLEQDVNADQFLTALCGRLMDKSPPLRRLQPLLQSSAKTETRVSARGSVILAGDYGVFANGLMVQLLLPLRATVERSGTSSCENIFKQYDPRTGSLCPDTKTERQAEQIREFLQAFREERCPKEVKEADDIAIVTRQIKNLLRQMPDTMGHELDRIDDRSLCGYSEYPSGSGAGDGFPSAILCSLLLPEGHDLDIGSKSLPAKEFLVRVCMLWHWIYTYRNFSYLRPLCSFCTCSADQPIVVMNRNIGFSEQGIPTINGMPNFKSKAFETKNLDLDSWSVLGKTKFFSIPDNCNFAVAYRHRRMVIHEAVIFLASTGSAVGGIKLDRDSHAVCSLSELTSHAIKTLELGDAPLLGRTMNAAHFTLSALSRGAQEIDKLVGGLAGTPGILGAKTSGSGPGGALVIAYNPNVAPRWSSNRSWEETILEHGHRLLIRSVRDAQD